MCEAGLIAQGAGAVTKSAGAFFTASGQQLSLRNDAYIADLNAKLADESGRLERQQGEAQQVAVKLRTGQIKSQQRVANAAGGVDLGEGSAARQLVSTEIMGQIDALTIDANAIRAQGQRSIEATNYRSSARTARMRADAISPFADAAISLLGSAGSIASRYGIKAGGSGGSQGFSESFQTARKTSLFTGGGNDFGSLMQKVNLG